MTSEDYGEEEDGESDEDGLKTETMTESSQSRSGTLESLLADSDSNEIDQEDDD